VIYTSFGRDPVMVGVCQAVVGSVSCVLLGAVGWRLFSARVGLVAGVTLGVSAPAIFSGAAIQPSVLDVFFLCLFLWFASRIVQDPTRRPSWLWSGCALGCLTLTQEQAWVFLVPMLVWVVVQHRDLGIQRLAFATIFVVGLAGALLPGAVRNQIVGGESWLTGSQLGPAFYIGNNAEADGTYRSLAPGGSPALERVDAAALAEQAMGVSLTSREVSRYWMRQALDDIISEPGAWVSLIGKKFALLLNATEVADGESQYSHADRSVPLRLAGYVTHVGVIAPLALFGVWASWGRRRELWLLYGMYVIYAASLLLFYVGARDRYPLVPFLALFASFGLVHARHVVRDTGGSGLVPSAVAVVVLAVLSNWPIQSKDRMRAATEERWGTALQAQGHLNQAVEHYRRAIELDPEQRGAHSALGIILRARGRSDEAVEHYRAALVLDPDNVATLSNLANVLVEQGNLSEASSLYRRALAVAPDFVEAHNNFGTLLFAQESFDEAARHFQEAIRLEPDQSTAYHNLGRVFHAQADLATAIPYYRRAVQVAPADSGARSDLGTALLSQGDVDEAVSQFRLATEADPNAFAIHNSLGIALGTQGDLEEAVGHFRRAVDINPDFAEAHNNLSKALLEQGQFGDAIVHLRHIVRLRPTEADAYNNLGVALAIQGALDEAVEHFRQAVQIDPTFTDASANLRDALQLLGR
jgi:tetratricopeptide (TPR) repeat protein